MSTQGPTGFKSMLFHVLCFQLAIFVDVPTPAEISGIVIFVETTTSSALQSAATSSILSK